MKKITTLLLMLTLAVAAHAQFQQGKAYLGASLTGVDLNYTGKNGLNLGIEGKAGYLLEDNWMVLAQASLKHTGSSDAASSFTAGIAAATTSSRTVSTWGPTSSISMPTTATTT